MRVHVTIPGTVESYCVDERGEKRKATDELWLETYLCSVLRAYSYADDGSGDTIRKVMGVRRFNPVTNTETEQRFLSAAEQLFFRGKLLNATARHDGTLTPTRLAAWLGLYRSGTEYCLEPPHYRPPEIFRNHRPLLVRDQSFREAPNTKCRGGFAVGQGLVHGQRRS